MCQDLSVLPLMAYVLGVLRNRWCKCASIFRDLGLNSTFPWVPFSKSPVFDRNACKLDSLGTVGCSLSLHVISEPLPPHLHVACPFGLSNQVAGFLTWHLRNSQVQKQMAPGLPKA